MWLFKTGGCHEEQIPFNRRWITHHDDLFFSSACLLGSLCFNAGFTRSGSAYSTTGARHFVRWKRRRNRHFFIVSCDEPRCEGETSCGEEDGCGNICQTCPPGETCRDDDFCVPLPLDCVLSDSFHFGSDFTSHGYISSAGVHPGISPGDSCGSALGVYFDDVGDWVQVSLAVDPPRTW